MREYCIEVTNGEIEFIDTIIELANILEDEEENECVISWRTKNISLSGIADR